VYVVGNLQAVKEAKEGSAKKKKVYTPFPPPQQPSKIDLQLESGAFSFFGQVGLSLLVFKMSYCPGAIILLPHPSKIDLRMESNGFLTL
jgi:hypothetical protein